MPDFSDEKLMERFASSGREADFSPLFRKYFHGLMRTARFLLHSTQDAEDAVQECFSRIIRARKSYKTGAPFAPWIFTILRNSCIDLIRKRKETSSIHDRVDIEAPFETTPETREYWDRYKKEVATLPETDRIILSLRYHNSFDFKEIASIVNLSEEAAKKRAYRAIAELRERLSK